MPLPRRRSLESSRRRRREKRQSREDPAASMYSPTSITPQQMPGTYSADSPQQQQQPYQPPPQQQQQQQQQPYQPPLPSQPQQPYQQQYPQQYPQQYQEHQQYQQKYQESFPQQTSLPMPRQATPHDGVEPRSRASSGSLSSSPSSSSSYLEISRQFPTSRYGGFFGAFMKAPSERRRRRRRGSGTKKRRGVFFAGGTNSSHSSINSDLAYGTGFVKKDKDKSTRGSSSVAGSAASGSQHQRQPQQPPYPAAIPSRPSPRLLNEKKRDKTDEEILAIGRQLSDLARQSNEEDLRAAGKSRPSGLASTAAAISALRKSRKEAKKRGLGNSKKHRDSSSDESDWESASDDDGDSSESSSSDESALHLAYGGNDSSRSNVALSGAMVAAAGAVAASVAESNPTRPTYHRRKSSVVDPKLFGPVNSLRGLVHTPCGFGDEEQQPPSTGSGRQSYTGPNSGFSRYDNDRPATGGSQADSARRPGSIPLEQPIPMVPVSSKVFEAGRRDSRNSYRRQLSDKGSLDPTLSGGVAAAAAAAAARMADQRGPWTEDRIYRDDVKRTRPDPDEEYFPRDQAPFEELERRRANPEVYYNRRVDGVDSPRSESDRQMPDHYSKNSPDLPKESRSWMELHPEERKESLRYQTTYDAHMKMREAQLRDAQRQQEQEQQTARATKASHRNVEGPAQPAPNTNVDPSRYRVADDSFNTPRQPETPKVVTVDRVPNFANPTPAPASAPPPHQPLMPTRPQTHSDVRLSRKDSFEIERAAEERRRGTQSGSRRRDPREGYEYEEGEREARSILDEAKRSTIPVAAVAVASAIAVEEERSRERRRRDYSDDGSRDRSLPDKDAVQEDADKYYRESVIARKIASDEIRSHSKSPDGSVVDKWEQPPVEEPITIVTPPNMEGREQDDDGNPYAAPNADVKIDNEIYPHETNRFRVTRGADTSRFRSRDPSCERERPLLNIVRPTPVPSPDSMAAAREELEQPTEVHASREVQKELESRELADSSEDEDTEPRGEATQSSPSGKSVSWGENSTKRFVVESPETRSRAESPNELAETEEKPRPRLSKISQWGKIAAMMAAGTSEPTTELDRSTVSRSRDLPADDDVNGAPPVPGPKPASPEPEQMPGTYADDEEFAATVAAGLEKTGFNPNIVIDDPTFRRRNSRPGTNETPAEMARSREKEEVDEAELSLTDTEDEQDEKTQKQERLNTLEKYFQMRQSGEIKPPSQPRESVEPPTVEDRPVTPPRKSNAEQRNMLEKFLQRRQSGEIQPPREVLEATESRDLEPVPEIQDEEDKKEKIERLEKFLQMRQSRQTEEPETTEPPIRRLEPEALRELEDSASDFAPANKSKKKKKKKRRDRHDELSTVSSRFGDGHSRLSIPGDEGTEISRVSAPGDEGSDLRTVYSVEDWEDWDSSPRSTRKSLVASELSTSSRRSTRGKRRNGSALDLREHGGNEPPLYPGDDHVDDRGVSSVISELNDEERKPRSRESKPSRYNDNSEKPVSSRKRKVSGKKPGFFSGIFNKSGGKNDRTEVINEKRDPFFEQAGTPGAGAGPASIAAAAATALTRSNAADVSSEPENISRELSGSDQEFNDHYPVIAPRAIAIDPQYRDLLPLPPSEPGSPVEGSFDELPCLPDSRPATPVEDRDRKFEKTHRRQRSNQENLFNNTRGRSYSNTAVPLAVLLRGIGSHPSSPVAIKPPRTPPRPTSWDSTKEFMPLMLLEHARRGSTDRSVRGEELPPLPPSEVTSEAEGGAMSDREESEDFRSPMPYPDDEFNLPDRRLRLRTDDLPVESTAVADGESQSSTPKADVTYELPVQPTDNTLGEAAARYEYSLPGPRTIGNDRSLTDDYDEPAPVESTPSSGQSARTVDAQAIPSPTTPTRRLSPQKDIYLRAEELTSADEPSDDFETARTSPADIYDEDLYEPDLPPIEPSMLGAIPEFSRPAKYFEDKVPEHSELASMDRVIETLPSIESVPEDQAQAREGSPSYPDPLSETTEESSKKGKKTGNREKNKSISSEAEIGLDLSIQPTADETAAAFVEVPESLIAKDSPLDVEYIPSNEQFSKDFTEEKALGPEVTPQVEEPFPIKESKAKPVMIEDESESESYAPRSEFESNVEEITIFEPFEEIVETPYAETVDIIPVSDELLSDAITEPTQRSDSEEVEEIIIGTLPHTTSRSVNAPEVASDDKEPLPSRRDSGVSGQDYPRKPEVSTVIEDSSESEEEEETDEEDDSEDDEDSDEDEEEEEEQHVEVAKRVEEEGHTIRDMTASIETLGAVSVVSTSSKKSKKKKKKKKKKRKKKKKSKAAAAAAATAAAAASHETPVEPATETTESTILPAVEPISKATPDATRNLPTEFGRSEAESAIESSTQPVPTDTVNAVEETPLEATENFVAPEPAHEASEQLSREIVEESTIENAQEAAAYTEPEHIAPAATEELRNLPSDTVKSTDNDEANFDDGLLKWAAADSEPIPHSDHVGVDKAGILSPGLGSEKDGKNESLQLEDKTIAVEEKAGSLAPAQEESDLTSSTENPASESAGEEHRDDPVKDREALVTDEMLPTTEETPVESPAVAEELVDSEVKDSLASHTEEPASVPLEESPSADREWAEVEDKEQDSEGTVAAPEYEQTLPIEFQELPTIMEEPGLEETNATEGEEFVQSEFDQDGLAFKDQLSPILEESMEDLLRESAPAETTEPVSQETIESKPEPAADKSVLDIDQTEDRPEQQDAEEIKGLVPIAEELTPGQSEATIATEDVSLEPKMDENSSRSIDEVAEAVGGKDTDWAPAHLPSFASDISEPLFTQGDAPSEYPTQQFPGSYEPTQMDESFVIPEESFGQPTDEQTEQTEAITAPAVPNTADEIETKADQLEHSGASVEPDVDAPVLEHIDKAEETNEHSTDAIEVIPPVEEAEPIDEQVSTGISNPSLPEPEPKEVESSAEGEKSEEKQENSISLVLEPTTQEHEPEMTPDELVELPSLETDLQAPVDTAPETRELTSVDESPRMEEQQPGTDEIVPSDSAPNMDLAEASPEENPPAISDADPLTQSDISLPLALEEEPKTRDDMIIEQPSLPELELDAMPQEDKDGLDSTLPEDHEAKDVDPTPLQESETSPPQELNRELDLEPKLEQEAGVDELKPPMDNNDLETGDSGDKSREVNVDTTESDIPLETGPVEDSRSMHEEEHRSEMGDHDNGNLDGEKEEEKTDNSDQSVEVVDSTNTLEPSEEETSSPQESNMTSEMEQPALEAKIEASPITLPNVDEKVESEHLRAGESEQMDFAQDGAIAPVSTVPEDPREEMERAIEAKDTSTETGEFQVVEDSLEPQEAQPQVEEEPTEPASERQERTVAEDLSQFETPAEIIIKDDTVDTRLTGTDLAADTNDVPPLDKDDEIVDEIRSHPLDIFESDVAEPAAVTKDVPPLKKDTEVVDGIRSHPLDIFESDIPEPAADTHDVPPLKKDDEVVHEIISHPLDIFESDTAEPITQVTLAAEHQEEQAVNDLQPEVPSTATDFHTGDEPKLEEPQPESKSVEFLPEEEAQQESKSEELEAESALEGADEELHPDSREVQFEPTPEESQQEPAVEELQQEQQELQPESTSENQEELKLEESPKSEEPTSEPALEEADKELHPDFREFQLEHTLQEEPASEILEEPKLGEPHPESSDDESEHESESKELQLSTTDAPSQEVDEATRKKIAKKEKKKARRLARAAEAAAAAAAAVATEEAVANLSTSDIAEVDAQPNELEAVQEPQAVEPSHENLAEPSIPDSTSAAETIIANDTTPADLEQLSPAGAISLPIEEQSSTELVDQPEPEAALAAEPAQGASKELTEEPQESIDPADSVIQQPTSLEAQEEQPRKGTSMHLVVPEVEHGESSASEYEESDSDDDDDYDNSTIVSDTTSLHGGARRSRYPRPNESTSSLTGFEVTAASHAEQHAHRAPRSKKKKKKKQKHKHKRKKSKAGSEPSSSLTSLGESVVQGDGVNNPPLTSETNLEGDVPKPPAEISASEPGIAQPEVLEKGEPESRELVGSDSVENRTADSGNPGEATESDVVSLPKLNPILEEAAGEEPEAPQPIESTDSPENKNAEMPRSLEESENADSRPMDESGSDNRDIPLAAAPAPPEDDSENAWDLFTGSWGKSSDKTHKSGPMGNSTEPAPDSTPSQEQADDGQMIEDAPLVDEPLEILAPQRRNSQTEQQISTEVAAEEMNPENVPDDGANIDNGAEPSSGMHDEKRDSFVSDPQSPNENDMRSIRPGSASSQGGEKPNQWFSGITGGISRISLISERFGGTKKKTRDRDKDPIPTDKEDPKDQSFLGNPAPRNSGDERSWEINRVQTIDDFLQGGKGPTTPNKRKKRQHQSIRPVTPERNESVLEPRGTEAGKKIVRRRGDFGEELIGSPDLKAATELLESLGPFELLRRNSQVADPIGGLLREASASEISVLPPMDLSEFSDYELSDYRLSPPRALPAVEELPEPEAEAEATASEVGLYRDSGFSGSLPSRSRRHSTSTLPIEEDEEKQRDSGVDGDWVEAAMAQLKTPEPMNRTPERPPQRRLRRSTLGGQRLRETASLRDAALDSERKTIPGTRERVLTGTGTRPETPTGRSSPTRKGYGAIAGMGIASRLTSGRASPTPASTERSDTPPALRRAATSPPVAGPLRSLRRAVSAQIGPGLQRPESPSLMPIAMEQQQQQPRSVSDSQIPSATKRQQPDPARPDPSNGSIAPQSPPNSGLVRQRTPERLKISHQPDDAVSGSTVRSSSNPTPPLLRRADKRGADLRSLRQQNTSSAAASPPSEAPVANEGRVRAKDKTDVYDGYGEGRIGSPLSPTRPHSMRRRQSMQVLQLEARVEQLIAENRLLSDARHSTEQHLSHRVVTALSDRDTQIESLNQRLKFLKGEVSRLSEVNDGLTSANAELANKDNSRYADLQVYADRDGNQAALMQALHEKDAQIADLTTKLDAAKERIRELQRQILESKAADVQFLNIKDEDYFDHRCQQLCSHVQQWVLRFSKFSDMRACRLTSEINDEKIIDRLDNAVLDGSDVDRYLNDRVRRRDIFMSMTMNMIWEFVFTRYLFGMDREQRQKLKSLEKLLTEVGPAQAVRQWRAVTLTLLSKRDSFKRQRDLDTEAVVQAIYQTLCKVLPPPSNLEAQIQAQLRRVMHEAVHLSIEMRTQKAEYMMLPPLQPEYDADGELVQTVLFNASMMSERSGALKLTNEELEAHGAIVRVVLFPLVVKKGDDDGSNEEEIVVCPAQVLIARSKLTRQPTPSTDGGRASAAGTGRLSGGTNSPDTRQANAI